MIFAREKRSGSRGIPTHSGLLMACERLLKVEAEIMAMPAEHRDWFMSKPGHGDCFDVARGLRDILLSVPPKGVK